MGISEALTDIGALFRVLDQGTPPLDVITAVAEGWADAGLARLTGATCEDPLTGLVSFAYLRTRLREIYREHRQRGASPADTHRLVVVDLPKRPDPWRRISLVILVGHDLRAAFPGGDTLALDRPGPAIALVQATEDFTFRFTSLRRAIRAAFGTEIRLLKLPTQPEDAERLLDGLAHATPPAPAPRGGDGTRCWRPADAAGLAEGTRPADGRRGRRSNGRAS